RRAAGLPAARSDRRARPGVEALEERQLLSAAPLTEAAGPPAPPPPMMTYPRVSAPFLNNPAALKYAPVTATRVDRTPPLKFSAALVKNTGDDAQASWWFPSLSRGQVDAQVSLHHARVLDLEGYTVNGRRRYAAVLVDNTDPGARNSKCCWGLTA